MRVCKRCGMISIHPPHAGRDRTDELDLASMGISIHPPRAGRDITPQRIYDLRDISIHPPRAGRDEALNRWATAQEIFQSTRPVRGGTFLAGCCQSCPRDFNPPAPCGAGRSKVKQIIIVLIFQSTRPVRGGTRLDRKHNCIR